MGRKVHPVGFRIGIIRDWQAKWYADKNYIDFLQEDLKLREAIQSKYMEAGISQVEIDRQANKIAITIRTARPGIVIGRGGQRVEEMRLYLESLIDKRIQLNILEIQQPELDAYLVAKAIAEQIERRISYRRAMKQAIFRTTQAGGKGIRVSCSGRLGGAEIARRQIMHEGQVPLHTLRADIDYGFTEARTTLGRIGVKVWIYKGEILPEPKIEAEAEVEAEAAEVAEELKVAEEPKATEKLKVAEEPGAAKEPEAAEKPKVTRKPRAAKKPETTEEPEAAEKPKVTRKPKAAEKPKRTKKPKSAKVEEKATEPVASESPEEEPSTVENEEKDATTKAGEIPQEP